jgi:hypothetical protein
MTGENNEPRGVHVTLKNNGGSVQHYYHFLVGFVAPLVEHWDEIAAKAAGGPVYVRSCAVLDPLLEQLLLPGLRIIAPEEHAALATSGMACLSFPGYDFPTLFDARAFGLVREKTLARLAAKIPAQPFKGAAILLVDRAPAAAFYSSDASEIKTAGAERRSITNFEALSGALRAEFPDAVATALEGLSLYDQIGLFAAADIIICQHGAALTNLIWSKKTAFVIEIMPKELDGAHLRHEAFKEFTACLKLRYARVRQESEHGLVDAGEFMTAVRAATKPEHKSLLSRLFQQRTR